MSEEMKRAFESTDPHRPREADVIVAEVVRGTIFLDESRRLRTVWRFLIFGTSFMALQIGVGMVVSVILLVGLIVSGNLEQLSDPQQLEQVLAGVIEEWTPLLMAIVALPLTAMTFGLLFVCRRYLDRRSIASVGFVRRGLGGSVLAGCLTGLTPIAIAAGILAVTGGMRFGGFGFSIMAIVMIPTLVAMAFMEEIVFRSYLLQNLLDIQRPVFGVVFTSLVFWIVHALNPHVWSSAIIPLNMFGAGVILALAYLVARNIWFPTALHFGWNAAQGPLLGLPVSGMKMDGFIRLHAAETTPAWLTGGDFGLEASLVVTGLEVAMIGVFLVLLRRPTSRNREEST